MAGSHHISGFSLLRLSFFVCKIGAVTASASEAFGKNVSFRDFFSFQREKNYATKYHRTPVPCSSPVLGLRLGTAVTGQTVRQERQAHRQTVMTQSGQRWDGEA